MDNLLQTLIHQEDLQLPAAVAAAPPVSHQ